MMLLKMGSLFPQVVTTLLLIIFCTLVAAIDAEDLKNYDHSLTLDNNNSRNHRERELQATDNNWDINYVNSNIDLSTTNNIDTTYEIGKDRTYMTYLLAEDCESTITGIDITTPTELRTSKDENHDILNVKYSIPLAMITSSNIWNAVTEQLIFCQVIQLVHPYPGSPSPLIISEGKWAFTVDVTFDVNFSTSSALTTGLVVTTFQGTLVLANFVQPSSPEEAGTMKDVLVKSIKDVVNGLLPENSGISSVTILSNIGGFTRRRMNKNDILLLQYNDSRILQESIEYEVVLSETCNSTETCNETANTSTIYDDVSSGLTQEIESGGFTTTLQANAEGTPVAALLENTTVEGGTTTEPNVEVLGVSMSGGIQLVGAGAELTSYIEAYKCGGVGDMTANTAPHASNEDLFVCIRSVSTDVEIESLDEMVRCLQ